MNETTMTETIQEVAEDTGIPEAIVAEWADDHGLLGEPAATIMDDIMCAFIGRAAVAHEVWPTLYEELGELPEGPVADFIDWEAYHLNYLRGGAVYEMRHDDEVFVFQHI